MFFFPQEVLNSSSTCYKQLKRQYSLTYARCCPSNIHAMISKPYIVPSADPTRLRSRRNYPYSCYSLSKISVLYLCSTNFWISSIQYQYTLLYLGSKFFSMIHNRYISFILTHISQPIFHPRYFVFQMSL